MESGIVEQAGNLSLHVGDGYSSRTGDSILNGCLPVVVMDNVDAAFESILDWNLFSIRIKEVQLLLHT